MTFCFSNGTHGFTTARCLRLMLEFSRWYVTLLSVCMPDWRKLWEFHVFVFFRRATWRSLTDKTGQFIDSHQNILVWPFFDPPSFLPYVSSLPNVMVVIFFSAIYCCLCYILRPPFNLCLIYICMGWPGPQGVFWDLEILYSKVKRGQMRRCEDIKKKCQYLYWVIVVFLRC